MLDTHELNALCTLLLLPGSQGRRGRSCISSIVDKYGSFANCLEYLKASQGGARSGLDAKVNDEDKPYYSEAIVLGRQLDQGRHMRTLTDRAAFCQRAIRQDGLMVLTYRDAGYPESLSNIPDPPLALFVDLHRDRIASESFVATGMKGIGRSQNAVEDVNIRLALVGSRRALKSSCDLAVYLGRELATLGFEVVSGMALGVDAAAHRGALQAKERSQEAGATIAVLGSGHRQIYPKSNTSLYKSIINSGGVVISEYLPIVAPLKQNFPSRNRIVSGISRGVIVLEATGKSGSLITARLALEQGRDVMAVPGIAREPRFEGCHRMIKQGAALVESVEDIVQVLGLDDLVNVKKVQLGAISEVESSNKFSLSEAERDILSHINFTATGLDGLISLTGHSIPAIMEVLVSLEIAGLIRACPGGYVRVIGDSL
ncbi:MAG: DNA-processing protein DprA [Pseudomonadales bacterium]|nr:DNA-processing protein DprA [Pseudomonadales bacterium]